MGCVSSENNNCKKTISKSSSSTSLSLSVNLTQMKELPPLPKITDNDNCVNFDN